MAVLRVAEHIAREASETLLEGPPQLMTATVTNQVGDILNPMLSPQEQLMGVLQPLLAQKAGDAHAQVFLKNPL